MAVPYEKPHAEAQTNKLSRGMNTGSAENPPNGADMAPNENPPPFEVGLPKQGVDTSSRGLKVVDEARGRNRHHQNNL